MKAFILPIDDERKPVYLGIAEAIRTSIAQGQLQPGERLPSARRLATELGVHRHTLMNALNELIAQEWLVARERYGYYVNRAYPEPAPRRLARHTQAVKRETLTWRIPRELPKSSSWKPTEWTVSFSSSVPDLRLFPFKEFRAHFVEHEHRAMYPWLDYGHPRGHPLLVEALELYLRRLRGITERAIVVTNGAQEGLYLVAQLLLRSADAVAVERCGYPHAWHAFRAAGAKLLPLELDEHGVDPDSLERLTRRRKIRLIYLTPLHQFPTTVTLPPDRRLCC